MESWLTKVATATNIHFSKPYEDDPEAWVLDYGIRVNRPNHGILHSIRQGILAVDIVESMQQYAPITAMSRWLATVDRKEFKYKVALTSAFQRSGRQSEGSSSDPNFYHRYCQYEQADCVNLMQCLHTAYRLNDTEYWCPGRLFASCHEKLVYCNALRWSTSLQNQNGVDYLQAILHAAHTLDLRRIPHFDGARIRRETGVLLGVSSDSQLIDQLWTRSGLYLDVTEDRDLVLGRRHYGSSFYMLSINPTRAVSVLLANRNM